MLKINELSAFQRNLNSLTLYLYLMNTRCKHLQDYDDEGDFKTHNYFFYLCRTKLEDKIEGDENLLINNPIFKNFDFTFENNKKPAKNKLTKEEKNFIYNSYFEYSTSLSKSKFRTKAFNYIAWSIIAIIILFFILAVIIQLQNYASKGNTVEGIIHSKYFWDIYLPRYAAVFFPLLVPFDFLFRGIILRFVINMKKYGKVKFNYMYSDDYCYKRIKEVEAFFRAHYNVENDYLEISEIERKFPKENNMFYNTVMETNTSEINKQKLLKYNENIFCRAVFSELFESIKNNEINNKKDKDVDNKDKKIFLNQIPYVFKACQLKTNIKYGNKGFTDCVNYLYKKNEYMDTTFNQAMSKLDDPKIEIIPKYLKILEKYEKI